MTNTRKMEIWLYIWGEVEQAGGAAVCTGDSEPGSRRGGFSIPNSLLIHAQVDRELKRLGEFARAAARRFYVDGWQWEEEFKEDPNPIVDSYGKKHASMIPTGKYFRKVTCSLSRRQVTELRVVVEYLTGQVFPAEEGVAA